MFDNRADAIKTFQLVCAGFDGHTNEMFNKNELVDNWLIQVEKCLKTKDGDLVCKDVLVEYFYYFG